MRCAASTCVSPAGRRNSSSSMSPGRVGGRLRSSTDRGPSVVVLARDGLGIGAFLFPEERDAVLLVDAELTRFTGNQGLGRAVVWAERGMFSPPPDRAHLPCRNVTRCNGVVVELQSSHG